MVPLNDDIPSRTFPFVTVLIVALNVLAFLYQVSLGIGSPGAARAAQEFIEEFGLIPCRLTGACVDPVAGLPSPYVTILSSMFLHGGLLHVGGNMLYLWIFGDNVEDTLGHFRFIIFYLLSGLAAALAQTAIAPSSMIPMIGARGAVARGLGGLPHLVPARAHPPPADHRILRSPRVHPGGHRARVLGRRPVLQRLHDPRGGHRGRARRWGGLLGPRGRVCRRHRIVVRAASARGSAPRVVSRPPTLPLYSLRSPTSVRPHRTTLQGEATRSE